MSVRLFATTFWTGPASEALTRAERIPGTGPRLIVTANMDHVILLSENADFRRAYDNAAIRTLDGMPLVWIARLLGHRAVRRVTGHDLLAQTLEPPPPHGRRVFLLCSTQAVAERMSARFTQAGLARDAIRTVIPPFGFEDAVLYSARLARDVRRHGTTLLVLGVGAPKSEIWVDRHADELGAPVCLAVGEAVTVAAGLVPRAPALIQRLGLEWLFRFAHAPRRLFRRYFVRSWRFLGILLAARLRAVRKPAIRAQASQSVADAAGASRPAPMRVPQPGSAPSRQKAAEAALRGPTPGRERLVRPMQGPRPPFLKAARTARVGATARPRPAAASSRR